eukprot:8880254-Ditylum_brightwellii.AAC.1
MLAHFPVPGNALIAEDKLCNILYQMMKHDWCNALCKSDRMPTDMSLEGFVNHFEQTKLLKCIKQKADAIIGDDNSEKKKNVVVTTVSI